MVDVKNSIIAEKLSPPWPRISYGSEHTSLPSNAEGGELRSLWPVTVQWAHGSLQVDLVCRDRQGNEERT